MTKPAVEPKKPYQAPKLTSEKLHEQSSLACGKASPAQPSCTILPTTS